MKYGNRYEYTLIIKCNIWKKYYKQKHWLCCTWSAPHQLWRAYWWLHYIMGTWWLLLHYLIIKIPIRLSSFFRFVLLPLDLLRSSSNATPSNSGQPPAEKECSHDGIVKQPARARLKIEVRTSIGRWYDLNILILGWGIWKSRSESKASSHFW